ncbi:MAG: LysM peptidoglycan-binding domain-containing protein [Anaerolineae bacterium]|nr:LysM peptidoglycan-binding domain-containing protein [Anaerolineae bacterium]
MKTFGRVLVIATAILVFLIAPANIVLAAPDDAEALVHVVAAGDTLANIAHKYGTTASALMRANNLDDPNLIFIGQRIVIPGGSTGNPGGGNTAPAATYTVKFGDTLSSIARALGVSMQALMQANNITEPSVVRVGQVLRVPGKDNSQPPQGGSSPTPTPTSSARYTVQFGDTLNLIAQRFGVSIFAIAQANKLVDINILRVGQVLIIPGAKSDVPPPPVSTPPPPPSTGGGRTYTVRAGDTWNAIAYKFEVYVYDLAAYNGLTISSIIRPGQVLRIPPGVDMRVGKRILVDLSDQRVYVYEEGKMIYNWPVSTGRRGYRTITGTFRILDKIPWAYASTWNLKMPYWMGIYWAGKLENGFHGQVINSWGVRIWDKYIGTPYTFGCVMLADDNMKKLYEWAEVGTPVIIRN